MNGNGNTATEAGWRGVMGMLFDRYRPTIGVKLGLFFSFFVLATYMNIHIAVGMFDALGNSAHIVNETGRLRYLSQRIAYLATRLDFGDRQRLREQIGEYGRVLDGIEQHLGDSGKVLIEHNPDLQERLTDLRGRWTAYADSVTAIVGSDLADHQTRVALDRIHGSAADMLAHADNIVNSLTETDQLVRERIHRQLDSVLVIEGLFLLLVFLFIQRGVSRPIRRLARICQSFASGNHSVRMNVRSRDEVGDLARSFNRTAEITSALICELNKRTKEASLLHRVAVALQEEDRLPDVFMRIARLLPEGWLYSEVAAARILWGEIEGRSADFRETPWMQRVELTDVAGRQLMIVVCYRENRPDASEGPFFLEECQLLGDVARMLKSFIEKNEARRAQARQLSILESTADLVVTFDAEGHILYLNDAARRMFGVEAPFEAGAITDHLPAWAVVQHERVALPLAMEHGFWRGEIAVLDRAGHETPMSQALIAHRGANLNIEYFSTIARDISDRIELEQRLTRSRDLYLGLFHDFPDLVWLCGTDGHTEYLNHAWIEFSGLSIERLQGDGWLDCLHPDDRADFLTAQEATLHGDGRFEIEYRLRRADGSYRWMHGRGQPYRDLDGEFAGIVGTCRDITERMRLDAELERLANHDALTGLPNRSLLQDRLAQALAFARRQKLHAAVMFLDLDRFKTVNDTLGHHVGDQLLVAVAGRLRACLREGDTVARIGGDEFVIVLPDIGEGDDLAGVDGVAEKLMQSLAASFMVNGQELFVSGSLGISIYPRDGEDIATLLKHADIAMYRAKDKGRNNHQYYATEMNARAHERLALETSLRHAIERDEFVLHYQPQIAVDSGAVVGLEALIRWRHPELGMVSPASFIPLAEETGLIVPIGEWVLRAACTQNQAWREAGLPPVRMAVNLSARQFQQRDVVRVVADTLASSGLPGNGLDLELTESMLMHDPEGVIATLNALKTMGVRIALDDFGTGYSSLAYLRRFPIDEIKIDQSFVRDFDSASGDAPLVRAIIGIARSLGISVVAEGVETPEQQRYLSRQRCDRMQGYLFSRPVPADEITALLAEGKRFDSEP
jgi:diguanylate cyclase (GGDEF)-like protein/PAS domain S-box-containing protein